MTVVPFEPRPKQELMPKQSRDILITALQAMIHDLENDQVRNAILLYTSPTGGAQLHFGNEMFLAYAAAYAQKQFNQA